MDGKGWSLSPAAEADLASLWQRLGDRLLDALFGVFDLLAKFPEMARERAELSPPVHLYPSGRHLVIYQRDGQGIVILRILPLRQNVMAWLQDG